MTDADRTYASARTASGINVLLGCWLIASPWIFSYSANSNAMWNSIVVGALVVLLAAGRISTPMRSIGSTGLNLLLGLWAIASPWIYGYAHMPMARWDCVATGIAIAALAAGSGGATRRQANRARVPTSRPAH